MKKKKVPVLVQVSSAHMPDVYVVDRNNLGPFLRGYLRKAIKLSGIACTVDDLDDPDIRQSARDCLYFYWQNRYDMEVAFTGPEYSNFKAGGDFWLSRNYNTRGYIKRGSDDVYDRLHKAAKGYGKIKLVKAGKKLTMERPNEENGGFLL